jgi:hypothetical protein
MTKTRSFLLAAAVAASTALASFSANAFWWPFSGPGWGGWGPGWGGPWSGWGGPWSGWGGPYGYGYAPYWGVPHYGYAPYGWGAPVYGYPAPAAAAESTEK